MTSGEHLARLDRADRLEASAADVRQELWKLRTGTVLVGVVLANIIWGLNAGWLAWTATAVVALSGSAWTVAWLIAERNGRREIAELGAAVASVRSGDDPDGDVGVSWVPSPLTSPSEPSP